MILLITGSKRGPQVARAIQSAAGERPELAHDVRSAVEQLRTRQYTAVVIDESLPELEDGKLDLLLKRVEPAMPVFVNLGVSRSERVVRDITTALRRAQQERAGAVTNVQAELRSQLRSELTSILLTTEQLLSGHLPQSIAGKLKSMLEVAHRMRTRLGSA